MKTTWNNKQGSRDRQARCVLVTKDGRPHLFTGASIPGVCHAVVVDSERKGKWSNSTFEITHHETTAVVTWRDDWDLGYAFPQRSWEDGFFWLAEKAPLLDKAAFEEFIRKHFTRTAERWDAARAAEEAFGFPATAEEVEAIKSAQERIAAEKAAYEEEMKRRMESSPFAVLAGLKVRKFES